MIGRRISHYRILERIGAGGMGEVYLAEDLALGRPTALKLLPDQVQEPLRARLRQEARLVAQAHAGLAEVLRDAAELERAESAFRERERFDHSWLWLATRAFTLWTLGRDAHALGQAERGLGHWNEARRTGFTGARLDGLE